MDEDVKNGVRRRLRGARLGGGGGGVSYVDIHIDRWMATYLLRGKTFVAFEFFIVFLHFLGLFLCWKMEMRWRDEVNESWFIA